MIKELEDCKTKCEDLRTARQEAVRELLTMQETRHAEVRIMTNSLQEEMNAREMVERRLSEMRTELERLQAENASEWAKRERLGWYLRISNFEKILLTFICVESDKINLERENKKIKAELMEAPRSAFGAMSRQASVSSDPEVRLLQQEIIEKNKVRIFLSKLLKEEPNVLFLRNLPSSNTVSAKRGKCCLRPTLKRLTPFVEQSSTRRK